MSLDAALLSISTQIKEGLHEPRVGELHVTANPHPTRDLRADGSYYNLADYNLPNMRTRIFETPGDTIPVSTFSGSHGAPINGFAYRASNNNIMSYVPTWSSSPDSNTFRISTNLGASFTNVTSNTIFGANNLFVYDFAADKNGTWMILASNTNIDSTVNSLPYLARSTNDGSTWQNIVANLPGTPNKLWHIAPGGTPGHWLVIGTQQNTAPCPQFSWFTSDNGNTWSSPLQVTTAINGFTRGFGVKGIPLIWDEEKSCWVYFSILTSGSTSGQGRFAISSGGTNPTSWNNLTPTENFGDVSDLRRLSLYLIKYAEKYHVFYYSFDGSSGLTSHIIPLNNSLSSGNPDRFPNTSLMTTMTGFHKNSSGLNLNDSGANENYGSSRAFILQPFVVGRQLFLDRINSSNRLATSFEFKGANISNDVYGWSSHTNFGSANTASNDYGGILVGTSYVKFINSSTRRVFDFSPLLTQFQTPNYMRQAMWGNTNPQINVSYGVIGLANTERNDLLGVYLRAK